MHFLKKLPMLLKVEIHKLMLTLAKVLNSMEVVILITNSSGTTLLQSALEVASFQPLEVIYIMV